jgi:hypothetical protein
MLSWQPNVISGSMHLVQEQQVLAALSCCFFPFVGSAEYTLMASRLKMMPPNRLIFVPVVCDLPVAKIVM